MYVPSLLLTVSMRSSSQLFK